PGWKHKRSVRSRLHLGARRAPSMSRRRSGLPTSREAAVRRVPSGPAEMTAVLRGAARGRAAARFAARHRALARLDAEVVPVVVHLRGRFGHALLGDRLAAPGAS